MDAAGIKVHCTSDRKEIIKKMKKVLQEEPAAVMLEDGGLFGENYYAVTNKSYEQQYRYYGKTKSNRPDGFGVLTRGAVDLSDMTTLSLIVYAGNFSKGRYDGYGARFFGKDVPTGSSALTTITQDGKMDSAYALAEIYLCAYVCEDGEWSDGKEHGKMNIFVLDEVQILDANGPDHYWGGPCYPSVVVTHAKKGVETGNEKYYIDGKLIFDGEMKNGNRNGKGTPYYDNGQKMYDGIWKNGRRDGSGKSYDENGKLIYSGKWKNGDYAS